MTLNTLKCNYLTPLRFKGLMRQNWTVQPSYRFKFKPLRQQKLSKSTVYGTYVEANVADNAGRVVHGLENVQYSGHCQRVAAQLNQLLQ